MKTFYEESDNENSCETLREKECIICESPANLILFKEQELCDECISFIKNETFNK